MDPALPAALRAAIDQALEGQARGPLAQRAGALSAGYRGKRTSSVLVKDGGDALAYALTRTPATYAATLRALVEVTRLRPGLAPESLLDAGAGPGGGSWAALEALPSLKTCTRLDHSPAFLGLAASLAAAGPPALSGAQGLRGALTDPALTPPAAVRVLAPYALTEGRPDTLGGGGRPVWDATKRLTMWTQPGTAVCVRGGP